MTSNQIFQPTQKLCSSFLSLSTSSHKAFNSNSTATINNISIINSQEKVDSGDSNNNNTSFSNTNGFKIPRIQSINFNPPINNNNNLSDTNSYLSESVFIDPYELKYKLEKFGNRVMVIFLDCRPFPEFNLKHIKDSVHLNCRDKIIKKRLQANKLSVRDLISSEEIKEKFDSNVIIQNDQKDNDTKHESKAINSQKILNNNISCVNEAKENNNNDNTDDKKVIEEKIIVVYDETCEDLHIDSNPLKIVQDNIKQFGKKDCKILKGGFKKFFEQFPQMCVNKSNEIKSLKTNKYYFDQQHMDQQQSEIENAVMTQITPYLYLGNELDAKNMSKLEKEGIFFILNVTKNIPFYDDQASSASRSKFKLKRIAVNDCSNQNLKAYYEEAIEFIDEARKERSKVLVHCQAGISRSPTIVIAYLMNKTHMKMNDAYNLVREKRPIIAPNLVFMSQLMDYESKLHNNKNTISNNKSPFDPEFSMFISSTNNNNNNSNNNNSSASNNSSLISAACHSEANILMEIDPVRVN